MYVRAILPAFVVFMTFGFIAGPVAAASISIKGNGKDKVEGRCGESGGVYFPPGPSGSYGCMNPDGGGIVCGGKGDNYKNTCDTFLRVPPRIPTRSELTKAEKAEKK